MKDILFFLGAGRIITDEENIAMCKHAFVVIVIMLMGIFSQSQITYADDSDEKINHIIIKKVIDEFTTAVREHGHTSQMMRVAMADRIRGILTRLAECEPGTEMQIIERLHMDPTERDNMALLRPFLKDYLRLILRYKADNKDEFDLYFERTKVTEEDAKKTPFLNLYAQVLEDRKTFVEAPPHRQEQERESYVKTRNEKIAGVERGEIVLFIPETRNLRLSGGVYVLNSAMTRHEAGVAKNMEGTYLPGIGKWKIPVFLAFTHYGSEKAVFHKDISDQIGEIYNKLKEYEGQGKEVGGVLVKCHGYPIPVPGRSHERFPFQDFQIMGILEHPVFLVDGKPTKWEGDVIKTVDD